jgi:hypothetical protein
MHAFIYFCCPLPVGLDELEDALEAALGQLGEVTGSGTGLAGSNLDVRFEDDKLTKQAAEQLLRAAVEKCGVAERPRITFVQE